MNPYSEFQDESHTQHLRNQALGLLIGAALFLYFGFSAGLVGGGRMALPVVILVWTLRVCGILLILDAILCWLGRIEGLILNALIGFVSLAVFVGVGAMALLSGDTTNGFLLTVFGIINGSSGLRAVKSYRALRENRIPME